MATVLATLPGLPMLGHGQVQGFGEKYGMEFRRAMLDEQPDPWLVERHEREIFPLFHRRAWFAEAHDFLLYDLVTEAGSVDESVLAYSNGADRERSLVLYHTRFATTSGRIRDSAPYALKAANGLKRRVRRSLAEGLRLPKDPRAFVTFRDSRTGLQYIRSCHEIWEDGLAIALGAYGSHAFWEFREVMDGVAGQWARLASRLAGDGVPSLDDALREIQLEPLHVPFRSLFADGLTIAVMDGVATGAQFEQLERRLAGFLEAVAVATGVDGDPAALATEIQGRTERAFVGMAPSAADAKASDAAAAAEARARAAKGRADADAAEPDAEHGLDRDDRAALLAWLPLSRMGALAPGADVAATSLAWYDELRLPGALVAGLHDAGFGEGDAWTVTDRVRVLLALPRPSTLGGPARTADARLLDAWLARENVRVALGINTWEGVEYLDRDRFEEVVHWAARLDAIDSGASVSAAEAAGADLRARLSAAAESARYRVDRLRAILAAGAAPKRSRSRARRALPEQDPPKE